MYQNVLIEPLEAVPQASESVVPLVSDGSLLVEMSASSLRKAFVTRERPISEFSTSCVFMALNFQLKVFCNDKHGSPFCQVPPRGNSAGERLDFSGRLGAFFRPRQDALA